MVFIKQKKGLIFTIVALVISVFLLLMFFYIMEVPLDKDVEVSTIKVKSANTFLHQVEDLAKAQAVASSRSAINTFLRSMHDQNQFLDDFDASFYRCLNTGSFSFSDGHISLEGDSISCGDEAFLKNKIEQDLASFARDNLGLDTNLRVSNFSLSQASPWDLEVSFDLEVELMKEGFYWNVSSSLSMPFSILGLKDPAHAVVDNSVRTYRPDNFADLVAISYHSMFNVFSDEWREKPSTLNILSRANNYIHNETFGVSYLDRLRGDMTPSEFGIFRIQLPIYDGGSIVYSGNSNIDWVFWQDETPDFGNLGIYAFVSLSDKIQVLNLDPPHILNNTLHDAIVPVALAEAANVSGASYFENYGVPDDDDDDGDDDDSIITPPDNEPYIESYNLNNLPDLFFMSFSGVEAIIDAEMSLFGEENYYSSMEKTDHERVWDGVIVNLLNEELTMNGVAFVDIKIRYKNSEGEDETTSFENFEIRP